MTIDAPERLADGLKTRYRSITDLVCETLRSSIVSGRYPPGMQLKEREVALEIGVSTTPVKAALQRLAIEGLVTSVPMRGSFVAENLDTQLAEFGLIRAALEGSAAYLAALKATEDDVERLRVQIETMRRFTESRDLERLIGANAAFHDIIHEVAGNATLRQITDMVRHYDAVTRPKVLADERQMARGLVDHESIFHAIEAHDAAEADARMRAHVLRSTDFLRGRRGRSDRSGGDDGRSVSGADAPRSGTGR
jgi:DNA-binding GntR family transcriptional regulator